MNQEYIEWAFYARLPIKLKRRERIPFTSTKNSIWNPESSSYDEDSNTIWVYDIYKADLVKLGATIIRSQNFARGWHFLISIKDKETVIANWTKMLEGEDT